MLTAKEIRHRFLKYFHAHGHEVLRSSPLIPRDDPTLLFTNAGMVPFKSLFLGQEQRAYQRATTSQKCLRVSGKHNDLENVGRTARHHTFFEMLGNFSFGDYFKEEALRLAWTFVTQELALPPERLSVTVFRDDDESFDLWQKVTGIEAARIYRLDEKDNFWAMGDTGPCGPCSEIYIDQGADMACGPHCGIGVCECDRFLEIWNLVFMQYNQPAEGPRTPLPRPSIDTGMGLERVAAVCQGKRSNYDCDIFQNIIQYAARVAGVTYSFSAPDTNDVDTALRVIADHSRAAAFLIADGVLPSNEGRGYVLRRLIRRALRFGTLMGIEEPFLHKTARKVADIMGEDFPELAQSADFLTRVVREEEERFQHTLTKGLEHLHEEFRAVALQNLPAILSGAVCFKLYDTYGFPLDIVHDIARKQGFAVDEAGFHQEMLKQKERARAAQKGVGLLGGPGALGADPAAFFKTLLDDGLHSVFTGHTRLEADSRLVALLDTNGLPVDSLKKGERGYAVTSTTPFYGASGGQVGDVGMLTTSSGAATVTDTLKPAPEYIVHHITVDTGTVLADQEVRLTVTENDRLACARNHTATHLLHAALRAVLGHHVKQAGSLVAPDRLRFDFNHICAMSRDEIRAVERAVNHAIMADYPVSATEMAHSDALHAGAIALFGEKYGDTVRVLTIGDATGTESVELCGGTHLARTGQTGLFYIVSESGVAAGVRRIEAVTGWNALARFAEQRDEHHSVAALLKAKPGELTSRIETLHADLKKLRKESEKSAAHTHSDIMQHCVDIGGIQTLIAAVGSVPISALRTMMDDARSKLPSGIVCLAAVDGDKVNLILYVSKDLHHRFTAPALIKEVAVPVGGSGGGRPDMAQAGGNTPAGVEAAFAVLRKLLGG